MNQDCTDFEELISAAIDGELDAEEFEVLDRHVDGCLNCRQRYQQLDAVNDCLIQSEQLGIVKPMVETSRREMAMAAPVSSTVSACATVAPTAATNAIGASNATAATTMASKYVPSKKSRHKNSNTKSRNSWLAGGALAAVGLAALLSNPVSPTINQPEFEADLVKPISRISTLNAQAQNVQTKQTKILIQELRTLRLSARYTSGDQQRVQQIEQKIEQLMQRVYQLEEEQALQP